VFDSDTDFKYGYLTQQSAAWAVLGVNFGNKFQPSSLTKDTDSMYVVSVNYTHSFTVNFTHLCFTKYSV
jgi:hypothetical protein